MAQSFASNLYCNWPNLTNGALASSLLLLIDNKDGVLDLLLGFFRKNLMASVNSAAASLRADSRISAACWAALFRWELFDL